MLSATICSTCPALRTQPLAGLSEGSRADLERWVAPRRLAQREALFQPGQWPAFVYVLREGSLKLLRDPDQDDGSLVELAFPGEWVGVPSLLQQEHFHVRAEALEPSAVCAIRAEEFWALYRSHAGFRQDLVRQLAQRIDQAQAWLQMRSRHDAASRLADALLQLEARRAPSAPPGLAMTKADLGQLIATAQETVFRLLGKFEKRGLIRRQDGRIRIEDAPRLRQVAQAPKNTGGQGLSL